MSYVTRNNGTADDAEDMLQDALIVLWERIRTGRFEHNAQLSTFIYATVKHRWTRELARKKRELRTTEEIDLVATEDPSNTDELIESEEVKEIQDAINRLGEPCRKLLILYYWEELSMEEIARRLGFANAETAKSKKYQCKEQLKKFLKR